MELRVDTNIADIARSLSRVERQQLPYATALALSRTAVAAKAAEEREMRDVFDRPTPYTMSAIYVLPATRSRLASAVGIKDHAAKAVPAAKFLAAQIRGGYRGLKRFERALHAVGALPPGYLAMPGDGATLDSYGNMSRAQIVQILSYFRAFPEAGYRANITAQRRAALARGSSKKYGISYFSGRPGDRLPLGIWQRRAHAFGSSVRPILIFVRHAVYQPNFDFRYVAETTIAREIPPQFRRSLAEAMATRK